MYHKKFNKAARLNRFKAITLTILFHGIIIGSIGFSGNVEIKDYIPVKVKQWLDMEDTPIEPALVEKDDRPRP